MFSVIYWGLTRERQKMKTQTHKHKNRHIRIHPKLQSASEWVTESQGSHCEWEQYKLVVPVSQLVLPVGVTGLTVNGKTPTPEPGSIVRTAAVRFKERRENTHTRLRLFQKTQLTLRTNTQRMESVQRASTWISLLFLGHSRQPARDLRHSMYYKEQLSGENSNPCTISLSHW